MADRVPRRPRRIVAVETISNPHRYTRLQRENACRVAYQLQQWTGTDLRFILTIPPDESVFDDRG